MRDEGDHADGPDLEYERCTQRFVRAPPRSFREARRERETGQHGESGDCERRERVGGCVRRAKRQLHRVPRPAVGSSMTTVGSPVTFARRRRR